MLTKVLQRPEVRAQFEQLGIDLSGIAGADFEKMIASEIAR